MFCYSENKFKRLKCLYCEKGFSYKYNFIRYVELVYKLLIESFYCLYCGKGFNLKVVMVFYV